MKRMWTAVAVMALAGASVVAAHASDKVQVDASMLVTGKITISRDGLVAGYQLDQQDKLPKAVVDVLSRVIPRFHFKPAMRHGEAVAGIAPMTIRLLARQTDKDHYTVSVEGYQFGGTNPAYSLQKKRITPPHYPAQEGYVRAGGIAYLLLQVNREGRVMHVYAQQVNLTQTPRDPHFIRGDYMRQWRNDFARAAVAAARTWTFNIPKTGPVASLPYWYARIPVEFRLGPRTPHHGHGRFKTYHPYGQWVSYIPGPRRPVPWLKDKQVASGAVDAQVPGTLFTIQPQPQLAALANKNN